MASSRPESIGRDFGDRPYLRETLQGREWVVTDLLQTSDEGSRFVIALGVRDQAGNLQGVLAAVVDPQGLGRMTFPYRTILRGFPCPLMGHYQGMRILPPVPQASAWGLELCPTLKRGA